jgi:hypothetical protein
VPGPGEDPALGEEPRRVPGAVAVQGQREGRCAPTRFPRAVQIHIDPVARPDAAVPRERRAGRSPGELFGAYLTECGHDDPAVAGLFAELYEHTQTVAAEDS